ncbi:MAG: response regulator [Thermodesulfobacteriota bacterium]
MNRSDKIMVLVVEDEYIVAWELSERLKRMGHAVCATVSTGEEAVLAAREDRPDLVLMDIMLAGAMDGIEAAEAIRTDSDTPVVFCSAYAGDMRARAERLAPLGFLEKPMDYDRLEILLAGLGREAAGEARR